MPISLNSGLITPKGFGAWQMVMCQTVLGGRCLQSRVTVHRRKRGRSSLIIPDTSLIPYPGVLGHSFSKHPTKKREIVTVSEHIILATKKKCNPTKIFLMPFLKNRREIKKTVSPHNLPIFSSNTKGGFLFKRLKDFP